MTIGLIALGVACLLALTYSSASWRRGRYRLWVTLERHGGLSIGLMVRYGDFDFAAQRGVLVYGGLGVVELWAGFVVDTHMRRG